MKKDKRGISLIVLVITIILMIILGATVILSLSGENTIKRAREAKTLSELSSISERVKLVIAQKQLEGINMAEGEYTLNDFGIESEYNRYIVVKDGQIYVKLSSPSNIISLARRSNIEEYRFLPIEYTKVEYLKGTGTQYIDTKIISDTIDYKFVFDVTFLCTYWEHAKVLVGDGTPADSTNFMISGSGVGWYQLSYKGEIFKPNYYLILNSKTHNEVIITQGLQEWIVNNNTVISSNKNDRLEQKNPILIFKGNTGTSDYADPMKAQLYNMKIYSYSNQKLLADYIPCYSNKTVIDANGIEHPQGTAGLYDIVGGKFYTNQGTGTFVVPTT